MKIDFLSSFKKCFREKGIIIRLKPTRNSSICESLVKKNLLIKNIFYSWSTFFFSFLNLFLKRRGQQGCLVDNILVVLMFCTNNKNIARMQEWNLAREKFAVLMIKETTEEIQLANLKKNIEHLDIRNIKYSWEYMEADIIKQSLTKDKIRKEYLRRTRDLSKTSSEAGISL